VNLQPISVQLASNELFVENSRLFRLLQRYLVLPELKIVPINALITVNVENLAIRANI